MAHLAIALLGRFLVTLDDKPVTGFDSDKGRALLASLVVESDRPHRRETLAGLLWPDYPESSARKNLRNVLANLRRNLGDQQAPTPYSRWVFRWGRQISNTPNDCWSRVWLCIRALLTAGRPGTPWPV